MYVIRPGYLQPSTDLPVQNCGLKHRWCNFNLEVCLVIDCQKVCGCDNNNAPGSLSLHRNSSDIITFLLLPAFNGVLFGTWFSKGGGCVDNVWLPVTSLFHQQGHSPNDSQIHNNTVIVSMQHVKCYQYHLLIVTVSTGQSLRWYGSLPSGYCYKSPIFR